MRVDHRPTEVLGLRGVVFRRGGRNLVNGVDLSVLAGQRWVLLGPNGAGKTSLVRMAALYEYPTEGSVDVLGHRAGRVDIRTLRTRVGFDSPALTDLLRPQLTPTEIVTSALYASLVPWWNDVSDADRTRARDQLDRVGCGALADRPYATLSSGERQRVLLARTLVTAPALLVLDEPGAALDLVAREQLIATLDRLATDPDSPAVLLVTHHLEEIPPSSTHAALMRAGEVVATGPIAEVLTGAQLSACFGIALRAGCTEGRWWARQRAPGEASGGRV